ncbi:hypothetical protein Tco_0953305 [Tanacetum coccineum]|uniref:Retrovirus-related Pol polyprotein from transposon TNT 1-94-like beta-barrel domain-containing protein n=1 Tax=Tanacetum coccineum TaxID=301880 RepID=A0ABQ5DZN7_9ASTR
MQLQERLKANLLKQQYKNFTAPSSEMLDQTFNRLQKLVSQLELLDEKLSQEDNRVKVCPISSSSTQNMAFVSSSNNNTSSTNEAVNTAHGVSTASTQVNTIGFDQAKVESYNFHKRGIGAGVQSSKRNQDNKNKESSKRSVHVETSTSTALVSCDGLGGYEWSDQAYERTNYALMAFTSSSRDSGIGLSVIEEKLKLKANESIYLQDIKGLKFEIHIGEITIRELRKKLEIVQKEKDGIQLNVDKFEHASKSLNKLIECQIVDNCKKGLGYEKYNAVPPLYTGNFMPPTPDLSFTGLDEFINEPVVENCKAMSSEEEPKVVRKYDDAPSIEEWVSDDEEEDVSQPKTEKKTVRPSIGNPQMDLQDQGVIDSGCSRHMTGNMSYLTDYEEIDGGYVAFGGNPKGGKITRKDPKSSHDDGSKPSSDDGKKVDEDPRKDSECNDQEKEDNVNSTNNVNTVSSNVNAASTNEVNAVDRKTSIKLPFDLNIPALEDYSIFDFLRDDEMNGALLT